MKITKHMGLVLIAAFVSILFVGCLGSGGKSAAPAVKDLAAINATVRGFMNSIVQKDESGINKYLAGSTTEIEEYSESSIHTLMVYDFGEDINDPDDNVSYPFTVNESDIEQPTENTAIVKAFYRQNSGEPLWLTFLLIKDSGYWFIETIKITESIHSSGPTNFDTERYFSIIPGASHEFAMFYEDVLSDDSSSFTWGETPVEKEGMSFYEHMDSDSNIGENRKNLLSLRADGGMPILEPNSGNLFLSIQESGLWAYGEGINGNQPFKMLEASHPFNSEYSFAITWEDLYRQTLSGICVIHIGNPTNLETGLQTYSAVPLTFTLTHSNESEEVSQKWRIWLAYDVGVVGTDEFYQHTDSVPVFYDRIISRTVHGQTTTNVPEITTTVLPDVIVESTMSSIAFTVSGGTGPFRWSMLNSSLPSGEYEFNSSDGTLSGHPQTVGQFSFAILVEDKYGRSNSNTFSLTAVESGSEETGSGEITTPSYSVGYSENYEEASYVAYYYVSPSEAAEIIDAQLISYSDSLEFEPWAGPSDGSYMLSVYQPGPGTHQVLVSIQTSDGKTHQVNHEIVVNPMFVGN
jgi:hypothetical protein